MDKKEVFKLLLTNYLTDNKDKISKDQFFFIVKAFILGKKFDAESLFEVFLKYDIDKDELKTYIDSIKEITVSKLERLFLIKMVFNMMAEIELGKDSEKYNESVEYFSEKFDHRIKNEQFRLKNRKKKSC